VKRHIKLLAVILAVALLAGGLLPTLFVGAQDRVEGTAALAIIDTRTKEASATAYRNPKNGADPGMKADQENFLELASMAVVDANFTKGTAITYPQWVIDAWAQGNYYIAATTLTTEYNVPNAGGAYNAVWSMTLTGLPTGISLKTANWMVVQCDMDSTEFSANGSFADKTAELNTENGGFATTDDSFSFLINPQRDTPRHLMLFVVVELPVVEEEPSESPEASASAEVSADPSAAASADATASAGAVVPEATSSPSPKTGDANILWLVLTLVVMVAVGTTVVVLRRRNNNA